MFVRHPTKGATMDEDHIFRNGIWIYADAKVPGGIVEIWRTLGANLRSEPDLCDDLNLLRVAVLQLMPTGMGRWNLALIKNVNPNDGRIALVEYSLSYGLRGARPTAFFLVKKIDYPEDQPRANELHEIQIDLHTALIDCDVRNCQLPDDLRVTVAALGSRLVQRALEKEISVGLVRRRAEQLLKLVRPPKAASA
jgi:hypothetical protein